MVNETSSKEDFEKLQPLPQGWVWTNLGDLTFIQNGYAFKSYDYKKNGIPLLRISNIENHQVNFDENSVFLDECYKNDFQYFLVGKGDIVIALSGATTGKYGIYKNDYFALLNQRVGRIVFFSPLLIDPLYIQFYMEILRANILKKAYGMAQPNISTAEIAEFYISLPPLSEQHRIVARIEELFTQLDAGVASLLKAQAQLKRYRQAVLKAAFEGRLTQEWREEHKGKIENFRDYLKKNWETYHKGKKFKFIDSSELPKIPEAWNWLSFEQVSQRVVVGHVGPIKHEYIENGVPFLRSQNVRENRFDPTGLKFISTEFHKKLKKSSLIPNDVLIIRSGSIGISCVVPENIKEANCCDLTVVKQPFGILPKLAAYYMNSIAQRRVHAQKVGVALIHFNTKVLASMPIPIPPIEEQKIILAEIERYLSIAEKVEFSIETSLRQADSLRQSILKRAFEGKLVPQNPNDEPASVLLERIKAEKARHQTEAKKVKNTQRKPRSRKLAHAN